MRDIIKNDCNNEGKRKEKIHKIKTIVAILTTLFLVSIVALVAADINWIAQDKQICGCKLQVDNHYKISDDNG